MDIGLGEEPGTSQGQKIEDEYFFEVILVTISLYRTFFLTVFIAGANHRGDCEAHGGEHQGGEHGGAGKASSSFLPQLKSYVTSADTNNDRENTAEPLQVGQGEVNGEVLLRRTGCNV